MTLTVHQERNSKVIQETLGRSGVIMSAPRSAYRGSHEQSHLVEDSPAGMHSAIEMNAQEAREQMSGFNMDCLEAFKRGDRIGLLFEGGAMFQLINEQRLEMALLSNQGSDESSIVDCFYQFAGVYQHTTKEQFVWDWVSYHELHHGTGYGKTYMDHFNLVKYLREHENAYPDLGSKINKLKEIARITNSFGNAALALVYPAYYYATLVGEEPYEFVRYLTSFTHAHSDAMKAVTLLCSFIENPRLLGEYQAPNREELKQLYRTSSQVRAYNTLMTAIHIADAGSEIEAIRRGVYVGGDTDSTLATAMLLWTIKNNL